MAGGLVLMPTETVYGLAADAANPAAVAALFEAKGRPRFNPLIAHVTGLKAARRFAAFDARGARLAEAFWPGPLTIVAPITDEAAVCDLARAGLDTVAVRAPGHPLAQALLEAFGGPVDRERGFVVHTDDYRCANSSLPIGEGLAWTATRDVLEAMGDRLRKPRKSILALGYAGWGAGQLERELQENVWLTCDPDEDLLFGSDHEMKWSQALAKIGVSADRLSVQAGRA